MEGLLVSAVSASCLGPSGKQRERMHRLQEEPAEKPGFSVTQPRGGEPHIARGVGMGCRKKAGGGRGQQGAEGQGGDNIFYLRSNSFLFLSLLLSTPSTVAPSQGSRF